METKRQEDIRKLMQMPEEAIASLNESEADRLGRLAVMFYKETGDGVYKEKAEQIRAAQGELPEDICAMPFFMEYETVCGKKERYNKIVDRMEDEASAGFADAKARNAYLAALVDVIDGISFEIYEKYRTLTAVYKRVLKDALAAILKGCNIGILLKEKYAETGALMAGHLKNTGMTDQTEYLSDITARTIEQYDLLAMEQSE